MMKKWKYSHSQQTFSMVFISIPRFPFFTAQTKFYGVKITIDINKIRESFIFRNINETHVHISTTLELSAYQIEKKK